MQINQTKQNLKLFTIMKTLKSTLLLLALGATSILSSCKKEDKEVDPRDAYVGTYETEAECFGDEAGEYDITISKDTKSATSLIIKSDLFEELGADDDEATAEIKGGKIVLKTMKFNYEDPDDGSIIPIKLDGEASVTGKTLSLNLEANGQEVCEFEGDKK
jgi:hypothetical protein